MRAARIHKRFPKKAEKEQAMKLTDAELNEILAKAGLGINQPCNPDGKYRKDEYLFTKCLHCGIEAHYRLKYILEKNGCGERVCRACYWREWYRDSHELYDAAVQNMIADGITKQELYEQGVLTIRKDTPWCESERLANQNGYDLIDLIRGDRPTDDIMVVRCTACGRQSAMRPQDVAFGCTCNKAAMRGGVPFGDEAKEPSVPFEDRKTAPCTPGAASLNAIRERYAKNPPAYSVSELKGKRIVDIPQLLEAWEDESLPEIVPVVTCKLRHFRCPNGHHPNQTPYSFLVDGCMVCRGQRTKASPNQKCLRDTNPELAEEWAHAKDGNQYTPETVKSGSRRQVWWRCIACGHEWLDTVRNRELRINNRCPECGKVMGSLAWQYPKLASEWGTENPVSPWNIKPHSKLDFKPTWICSKHPSHTWTETVASRIKKNGSCPHCLKGR